MRNRISAALVLSLALLAPTASPAEVTGVVAADAGCTAPSEEGCAECCRPVGGGMCTQLSWTGAKDSPTKPWYNAQRALGKPCRETCKPCARCLERDKNTLAKLKAPEGCDCAETEIGVDPCHSPRSCACFCSRHGRLAAMCAEPAAADDDDSSSSSSDDEG
ncbi:MAG: hypothetical protein P8R42_14975 [Candidatus Binatia bacterium]|nr:hypothetical protein [Candidatus Binatia bacterium]